jgi:hypothetical protein
MQLPSAVIHPVGEFPVRQVAAEFPVASHPAPLSPKVPVAPDPKSAQGLAIDPFEQVLWELPDIQAPEAIGWSIRMTFGFSYFFRSRAVSMKKTSGKELWHPVR